MSARYMVISYRMGPLPGGAEKWYYNTIEEARDKLSDLLATLPERYNAEIIVE